MKTLLIDDDPTALFLTQRLFQREGLDALTAFLSPVEALSFIKEQALTDLSPQVILLDLNMPLLNGWEFMEALKPLEAQLLGRCSVYILTSSLAPGDVARVREYPLVVSLIHKPLNQAQIQAIQARLDKPEQD
jgi:CheY-like chemotaxis protein